MVKLCVNYSELIPPGLRLPAPRTGVRRKRDRDEEGVGFSEETTRLFDGYTTPFFVVAVLALIGGGATLAFHSSPEMAGVLLTGGTVFLLPAGFLFASHFAVTGSKNRYERHLVRIGTVVVGNAMGAETLPIPDDFGCERTVHFCFTPDDMGGTINGAARTVSGRLDSVKAGDPVAVLYNPADPSKHHALYKMLSYTADPRTS